jgi:hypothetical protein
MVCIDEVHLMVQFGLRFRAEFLHLKELLFLPLLVAPPNNKPPDMTYTMIPVLFMTATADSIMLRQLEDITGYSFHASNLFWPSAKDMTQRRQALKYMPTTMIASILRPLTKSCFGVGSNKKFIVYGNSRLQVEQTHSSYRKWLDDEALDDDVILIVGTQSREQKFHQTTLFLNPAACHRQSTDLSFNARGCFTTRAMGSAGWDDPSIHYICSVDFPVDILSLAQEKGRAGRRATAMGKDDIYYCVASLESYLYLLRRIEFDDPSSDGSVNPEDERLFDKFISKKDFKTYQLQRLSKVLKLLVLPTECQQCTLERELANPFSHPESEVLLPCVSFCQFCVDKGVHPKFPRININGLRKALVDLFLGDNQLQDPGFEKGGLIDSLRAYPDASILFFSVSSKSLPSPIVIKNLLLMLFTADLLTHRVVQREVPNKIDGSLAMKSFLLARLQTMSNGTLAIHDDSRWLCIPCISQ